MSVRIAEYSVWCDRDWCGIEHFTGDYGIKFVFATMRLNVWNWNGND